MMKALQIDQIGSLGALTVREVADPYAGVVADNQAKVIVEPHSLRDGPGDSSIL